MKLTILMYHKVDELAPGTKRSGNYVAPRAFAEQMEALLAWGYRTITVQEWLAHRERRAASLPDKPLIVTFDDGYTCFARNAWPVLRRRGMGAIVFVVAVQIGGTNAWDADEPQEPLLDAGRILALQSEGVVFGSHAMTHQPLARIGPDRAWDELTRSRAVLADLLGSAPEVLAYPYSNQNRVVRDLSARAGYRAAVRGKGRMNSRWTSAFGLRRIKVEHDWTVADLERRLSRERRRVL